MSEKNTMGETPSEDTSNLAYDLGLILNHPEKLTHIINPPTLAEWMRFIEEYLTADGAILTDDLLKTKMDKLEKTKQFSKYFPENYRICATIIPCNSKCGRMEEGEIRDGKFIQFLRIPPEGTEESKVDRQNRLMFEFMPAEIKRDCSFSIGGYAANPDGNSAEAVKERMRIVAKCAEAMMKHFDHAKKYFQIPGSVN